MLQPYNHSEKMWSTATRGKVSATALNILGADLRPNGSAVST